jgi:beta-phosphoglucomutase-like phosphatase (HAD superfamily)
MPQSYPIPSPILIIFDMDGTLIDANTLDNDCFDRAFREVTGVALTELMSPPRRLFISEA